ncbi:hypothetical protein SAY87_015079 [Trapa incisa]|uniref:Bifunctional inhibitor/plant lipid transfer protein/seed storage helical domain-containing protein n=1 Tax=Trapa incisa TaxID=236973 RepID=A0AAN7JM22_9MYRT|nr:hypothetical protein SAY87_015079 [Trapa incisa]
MQLTDNMQRGDLRSDGMQASSHHVNPLPPTASCCSALSHADMGCLCSYKNSNILLSLGIDPNLVM